MAYTVTFVPAAAKSIEKFEKVLLRRLQSKVLSLGERRNLREWSSSLDNRICIVFESVITESCTELMTWQVLSRSR